GYIGQVQLFAPTRSFSLTERRALRALPFLLQLNRPSWLRDCALQNEIRAAMYCPRLYRCDGQACFAPSRFGVGRRNPGKSAPTIVALARRALHRLLRWCGSGHARPYAPRYFLKASRVLLHTYRLCLTRREKHIAVAALQCDKESA